MFSIKEEALSSLTEEAGSNYSHLLRSFLSFKADLLLVVTPTSRQELPVLPVCLCAQPQASWQDWILWDHVISWIQLPSKVTHPGDGNQNTHYHSNHHPKIFSSDIYFFQKCCFRRPDWCQKVNIWELVNRIITIKPQNSHLERE